MFNHVLSLCWIEEVSPSLSHIERGCIPLPCPGLPLSSFPPPIFPHSLTHPPLTQFNLISNLDTRQIKISGPLKLKTQIMCEHVRWPSLEVLVKVLGCQPPARDIRPNRYTTLTTHPNVSVYSIRNIFSKYLYVNVLFSPNTAVAKWWNWTRRIVLFVNPNGFTVWERGTQCSAPSDPPDHRAWNSSPLGPLGPLWTSRLTAGVGRVHLEVSLRKIRYLVPQGS